MSAESSIISVSREDFDLFSESAKLWLKIREAELQIIGYLEMTDEFLLKDDGDVKEDAEGLPIIVPKDLPIESDVSTKLASLQDNFLFPQLDANRNILSFRTRMDVVDNLLDTFGVDSVFIKFGNSSLRKPVSLEYNVRCLSCFQDNVYLGCVWVFTHSKYSYIGMYGLRGTVINLVARKRKGVAKILLDAVIAHAKKENLTDVIVPWPLPPMVSTLTKSGFVRSISPESSSFYSFISPIATTQEHFILKL